MPPKDDRNAVEPGDPQKDQVVKKAFETGAVLQQAAATQHECIHLLESADRLRQGATVNDARSWNKGSSSLVISGCDHRVPSHRKLGDEHLQQGIIAKIVLTVITT